MGQSSCVVPLNDSKQPRKQVEPSHHTMVDHSHLPRTAKKLAEELVNNLETIANIHYLLEQRVTDPAQLAMLRRKETEVFGEIVQKVLHSLSQPG